MKFKIETEFQETEIGKIPKNWKVVRLKEIALEIKSGFASGKRDDVNGVVHLRMFNIGLDGILTFDEVVKVPKPEDWKQYLLEYGDILLVNTSGSEEHIGKVAFFEKSDMKCTYSNHLTRIRINRSLTDPKWIYFVLYYLWYKGYFRTFIHQQAGGQRNIPLKTIENIPVILPPYNEVKRLVKILTSLQFTSKKVNEAINKLTALKKALMRELLTGRIRVNEENGKLVFHRETEFQETKIGKIPREWEVVSIRDSFELYKGTTPSTKNNKYWGGSIPFVTPTDITAINDLNKIYLTKTEKYLTKEGVQSRNLRIIPAGSLLFTSRATIGYLAINSVEVTINQGVIALIPKRNDINVLFYYYYLINMRRRFEELSGGSTYKEISMSTFSRTTIPQPSSIEQKKIAEILLTIDKAIGLHYEEKVRLNRLRRGLMNLLLTGKIRVLE